MSVSTVQASPTGWGGQSSAFGSVQWAATGGPIVATIPLGGGTMWLVWQIYIPGLVAGQPFNGVVLTGTNDFTVGGGGAGITRVATVHGAIFKTFGEFFNAAGAVIQGAAGTGAGAQMNATVTNPAMTTNDLLNATAYLGICVSTDNANPAADGVFRYNSLTMTFYTGADVPNVPPSQPNAVMNNPASNYNPGQYAGGVFTSVKASFIPVTDPVTIPQQYLTFSWSLPVGLIFQINGTRNYSQHKGTADNPDGGDPYVSNCGGIAASSTILAGSYLIACAVQGGGGPWDGGIQLSDTLVVAQASLSMLTEA